MHHGCIPDYLEHKLRLFMTEVKPYLYNDVLNGYRVLLSAHKAWAL
jgi:hypothetical protein